MSMKNIERKLSVENIYCHDKTTTSLITVKKYVKIIH